MYIDVSNEDIDGRVYFEDIVRALSEELKVSKESVIKALNLVNCIENIKRNNSSVEDSIEDIKNILEDNDSKHDLLKSYTCIYMMFEGNDEIYIPDSEINELSDLRWENYRLSEKVAIYESQDNDFLEQIKKWYYDEEGRKYLNSDDKQIKKITSIIRDCVSYRI